MATLEEFLKEYINTKRKQNSKESFDSWSAKYGNGAEDTLASSMLKLDTGLFRAQSGYGARAERLADSGLSGSGYAQYLDSLAKERYGEQKRLAASDYARLFRKNAKDYARYSEEYDVDISKLKSSVIDDIRSSGTLSYDTAYLFAINAGLPDEEAMAAAKSGSDMARQEATQKVYDTIMSDNLTSAEAIELSKGLGFTEAESESFGEYAKIYTEYRRGDQSLSYSEYLKKRLEELQEKQTEKGDN